MSNIFKNNLRASIILGIVAVYLTPVVPALGAIAGIFGFYKGRAAAAEGKYLASLGIVLSLISILHFLFTLFFPDLEFTRR